MGLIALGAGVAVLTGAGAGIAIYGFVIALLIIFILGSK